MTSGMVLASTDDMDIKIFLHGIVFRMIDTVFLFFKEEVLCGFRVCVCVRVRVSVWRGVVKLPGIVLASSESNRSIKTFNKVVPH